MLESTKIPKGKFHLGTFRSQMFNKKRMKTKEMHFTQSTEFVSLKDALKACKYSVSIKSLSIDRIALSHIMGPLLESIKTLASLRALEIRFQLFTLKSDRALHRLSKGLRRLNQLQILTVCCRVDDNGIKSIGNAMKRMALLKEIDFVFYKCLQITDSGFIKFGQGLKQCKSLQRLILCFDGCEKITDKGFDGISQAISKLKALTSLELLFISGNEENNASIGLKSLGQSLGSLVSLKDISLHFTEFQNIKDDDMGYLKEGLKKLGLIESIHLCFIRCQNITDFGLKEICEGIAEIQSLKIFSLKLMELENLTDQGLKTLGQALSKMTFLEDFYLHITNCVNATQNGVDELKKELEKVTGLKSRIFSS